MPGSLLIWGGVDVGIVSSGGVGSGMPGSLLIWGGVDVGIVSSGGLGAAAGLGLWLGRRSLITKMASRSEGVRGRMDLVIECGGVVNTFTTVPSLVSNS